MVVSTLLSRPMAGFLSRANNSGHQSYEEILIDDDEEYYEEIIVDDDDDDEEEEEYIEEVIEEDVISSRNRAKDDLLVTQEQVDGMSFENAKRFLMALPNAKGPTLAASPSADDDYEYEEIEMPEAEAITPIQRSRRCSLFEPPALDNIIEESSERSERSGANSVLNSPSMSNRKQLQCNLSNIAEGLEKSPGAASGGVPSPAGRPSPAPRKIPAKEEHSEDSYLPEGTTLVGGLNDTEDKGAIFAETDPSGKPVKANRSGNRSNKSLQSEGTDTTMSESGSSNSLDIRQVFATPPASPHASPDHASHRKPRSDGTRRPFEEKSPDPSMRPSDGNSLGTELKKLGNSSGHSGRRRSGGSRRGDDDDDDNRSTRSGKSRRSAGSGRSGTRRVSTKTPEDRAQSVEEEIMSLLSPVEDKKKRFSLDSMLSEPHSRDRGDSDNISRSSRSRRHSSKGMSSEKSRSSEQSSSGRRGSTGSRMESPTKEMQTKKRPTLKEGSKTLDDLLARMPSEPKKRSDARSTASGMLRSSRGRDNDRDSRSVVGGSSNSSSSRRPARARSARRTKKGDDDEVSVVSMPAMVRKVRSRSSSVGRKERLRRNRRNEDVERANRKHQDEIRSLNESFKDDRPNSNRSNNSSSRRPSSSKSRNAVSDDDEMIEPGSRTRRGHSDSRDLKDDKLQSPRHHKQNSSGKRHSSGSHVDAEMIEAGSRSRRDTSGSRDNIRDDELQSPTHTRHGSGGRSRSSDGQKTSERSTITTSTSSKTVNDKSRPPRKVGIDESFDEMDGNASFSRTLMLARSLHSVVNDELGSPETPNRKSSIMRSSSGGSKSPGDSHVRRSPTKSRSADDFLLYEPDHDDNRRLSSRLSSVASSMRDASQKPPKTPKDRRREPLQMKHSSDDVLLVPELATSTNEYDLDEARKHAGSNSRKRPSLNQTHSSRNVISSSDRHEHRQSYHSPRRLSKAPATPSSTDKTRVPPPRSQSEQSPGKDSPIKLSHIRQACRPSDYNGGSAPPVAGLTPFERLSELEKIKTFLTEEEYQRKKKEILACI